MPFASWLIALAGFSGTAPYPIPPRPLRLLVEEADYIVTARVTEADTATRECELGRERRPGLGLHEVVALEVDGLVKGDPGTWVIPQRLYPSGCPAPARYFVGTRVLAFLDRDEHGRFSTHAMSYGAKTLDDAGMTVYLQRIREQLAIQQMPDDESRVAAQVEWLVKCAEHPVTRWEGAYELARAGDFMSHYEREKSLPDFASCLTPAQRGRLLGALLGARRFEDGERCLEELFRDDSDPRLLEWLVERLRADHVDLAREGYGSAVFLIERIARRDGRPETRAIADAVKARQSGRNPADGSERLELATKLLALF